MDLRWYLHLQCPFAKRALGQAFVRPGGKNSISAPAEFWSPPALTGPSQVSQLQLR
jgi:hypothetical protein